MIVASALPNIDHPSYVIIVSEFFSSPCFLFPKHENAKVSGQKMVASQCMEMTTKLRVSSCQIFPLRALLFFAL